MFLLPYCFAPDLTRVLWCLAHVTWVVVGIVLWWNGCWGWSWFFVWYLIDGLGLHLLFSSPIHFISVGGCMYFIWCSVGVVYLCYCRTKVVPFLVLWLCFFNLHFISASSFLSLNYHCWVNLVGCDSLSASVLVWYYWHCISSFSGFVDWSNRAGAFGWVVLSPYSELVLVWDCVLSWEWDGFILCVLVWGLSVFLGWFPWSSDPDLAVVFCLEGCVLQLRPHLLGPVSI